MHFVHGARAVIGHNVRALIERLEPRSPALDALLDAARELDLFCLATRYPNSVQAGTPGEAFSKAQLQRAVEPGGAVPRGGRAAAGLTGWSS